MNRLPHREQDFAFGQLMLTLRTAIGLTQAGLAEFLGVSRRAVGDWEAGNAYPKSEHLKQFIALAVREGAVSPEQEAEQIRDLWRAAHQKVLLDEAWLASLLQQARRAHPGTSDGAADTYASVLPPAQLSPANRQPKTSWGSAITTPAFYGREWELAMLTQWVVEEQCRVVSLLGFGGIGKSALSVKVMQSVAHHFEVVIWRSVRDAPPCEALIDDWLQVLAPEALDEFTTPASTDEAGAISGTAALDRRINLLLKYLRSTGSLLVLDNLESLLDEGERAGELRAGYEGYGRLLRRIAESEHRSCLLLTSREKPEDLAQLEGSNAPVRVLRLSRLGLKACSQLLSVRGVEGTSPQQMQLIEQYEGNPLALKIVAQTVVDLFDGDVTTFLAQGVTIYGGVRDLLAEQFSRLSTIQQSLMFWLAILREPCTLDGLGSVMVTPVPPGLTRARLLEVVEALRRRSLIEPGASAGSGVAASSKPGSFTLQSVVLEYMTERLIVAASDEIEQESLTLLVDHAIAPAQAPEYVRQTELRLIVAPLLVRLQEIYPQGVEARLLSLLSDLRARGQVAQGYGPANLVALLLLQRGNLRGLDLSGLSLRGAYLQGVEMQDASLAGATIQQGIFTEAFGVIITVATDSSGEHWASCNEVGEVRVWELDGRHSAGTPRKKWQTRTDTIWRLAFSPDGRTLVGGGWDGKVMMWEAAEGPLLWSSELDEESNYIFGVTFAPNGSMIASGGNGGLVRLWDAATGSPLQTLRHPTDVWALVWRPWEYSPYEQGPQEHGPQRNGLNTDQNLLVTGDREGTIRLWQVDVNGHEPAVCILTFPAHAQQVAGLAFSPDGGTLASASWDTTVKLWQMPTGNPAGTLRGHTDRAHRVAWSSDGRTLASGGFDKTIWLWDTESRIYRAALRGHTSPVRGLVFTPNSVSLLSGSDDGTLREWDVTSGQSTRIVSGYAVSLNEIDWSPDGKQLVTSCSDSLLAIFESGTDTSTAEGADDSEQANPPGPSPPPRPPRLLRGHTSVARSVGWSKDGRWLASTEANNNIRLWEAGSGEFAGSLRDTGDGSNNFSNVEWSPDGRWLASGTNKRGILVFDMVTRRLRWDDDSNTTPISSTIAWSLEGTQVAGGSFDGNVYVWNASDGKLVQRLSGHSNVVITVSWSPSGIHLASSGGGADGGELIVWDAQTWQSVHAITHPRCAIAWSADGAWLICDNDRTLCWWDVQRWERVRVQQTNHDSIIAIRRSPDGTTLASCGAEGAIMLWDVGSGEHIRTLRRDRPYERLDITGIKGLTEAQKATLHALGATEDGVLVSSRAVLQQL